MNLKYLIDKVFDYDTHRSGSQDRSISVTTLIDFPYKAYKHLNKHEMTHKIPSINKRGSTLGTAFHEYAEKVVSSEDVITEIYAEQYLFEFDAYITGTFDMLVWDEDGGEFIMADWKTSVKKFDDEAIAKATRQMSIYRWLNSDKFNISDEAHILFVSTSRNDVQDIIVQLMSIEETIDYVHSQLEDLKTKPIPTCPRWLCGYCEFQCEERV